MRGMDTMNMTDWPVDWEQIPERETEADRVAWQQAADTAVGVLWALTGRQYGLRAVEARPCPQGACVGLPLRGTSWEPVLDGGVVRNVSTVATYCGREGGVHLPGPVHQLLGWVVDGEERPADELHLQGGQVYRVSGEGWPGQDLGRPATEQGTWAVRYLQGVPVPPGGGYAVARLAQEFHAAATGGRCQLPRRVQNVTRQGVTVSMIDPSDIFASGATGLPEVDLFIRAHNPYRQAAPSEVWSPDLPTW